MNILTDGSSCLPSWELGGLCRYDSTYDSYDYGLEPVCKLHLHWYQIVKETPCGYWIELYPGSKQKFVLKGNGKRFAYTSEQWALESFKIRKIRHIQHLKYSLEHAEAALELVKEKKI